LDKKQNRRGKKESLFGKRTSSLEGDVLEFDENGREKEGKGLIKLIADSRTADKSEREKDRANEGC